MKTSIRFIVLLFIIGSLATTASTQHLLSLEEGRMNDLLTVRLHELANKHTSIDLIGTDGKSWLTKQVYNKEGYVVGLNLSLLPDGNYLIVTRNQRTHQVKAFNRMGNDLVIFQPKAMQHLSKAEGRFVNQNQSGGGQLIVRMNQPKDVKAIDLQLANLREEDTNIYLTSLEGIPVFSHQIRHANGYARRIDLEQVGDGDYALCIETPQSALVQLLSIDKGHVILRQALSKEKASGQGILMASRP